MKRPRPYIPLEVRVVVAERQAAAAGLTVDLAGVRRLPTKLHLLLRAIFPEESAQLDHDPALILRPFDPETGRYTPDANDPAYLVYRTKPDHLRKTIGRKLDAAKTVTTKGSDIWLKAKFDRLEGRTKTRPKAKIASRPFPKVKRRFGQ